MTVTGPVARYGDDGVSHTPEWGAIVTETPGRRSAVRKVVVRGTACAVAAAAAYLVCTQTGPVLFHYLVETPTVVIAAAVFAVVWNGRPSGEDGFLLVIGPAFGSVAVLGALHLLTSDGVGVPSGREMDLPAQLGAAALGVQSVSLLVACWAIGRSLRPNGPVLAYSAVTLGLVLLIFETDLLPHCVGAEGGPTPFQLAVDGVACTGLGASALWLFGRRRAFSEPVLWMLLGSVFLMLFSGYWFAQIAASGDLPLRLAHLVRLAAFGLVYLSVAQMGPNRAREAALRELSETNRELRLEVTARAEAEEAARKQAALLQAANRILHEALVCSTCEDIARVFLSVAMELTDSRQGFVGLMDDRGRLQMVELTERVASAAAAQHDRCGELPALHLDGYLAEPLMHGRSVILDDSALTTDPLALPDWHAPVTSFIGVPFKRAGIVMGMVGLADKPGGYGPRQSGAVEDLSVAFVEACSRKEAEQERERLGSLNEAILNTIPDTLLILDSDLNVVGSNRADVEGYPLGDALAAGRHPHITEVLSPALVERAGLAERLWTAVSAGRADEVLGVAHPGSDHAEHRHDDRCLDIRVRAFDSSETPAKGQPRALITVLDATRRHVLEEQAQQRSKLESIGTLAGGVAHDFNNILTGIIGYTSILLEDGVDQSVRDEFLREVNGLAQRAAGLTRQLLVFSRRERMTPVPVDVNACIGGVAKMLERIIGEDIELRLALAPDVSHVRADPTHIEQIVMNLAVNARDAMHHGGRLTIETANALLDGEYAHRHVGVAAGEYILITVSDTGCGMDDQTKRRMFEPFFTTKDVGKGTGLGLATVYGIVEQHGGHIQVHSRPDHGTMFRVYLPAVTPEVTEAVEAAGAPSGNGNETILVVEDEHSVLDMVRRMLSNRNYTVLTASSPGEAETVFSQHESEVGLLLTDVVLPEMHGPALYERLADRKPSLSVLYMSGYTERAAFGGSQIPEGAAFLHKPFSPAELARRVREVLDERVELCVEGG